MEYLPGGYTLEFKEGCFPLSTDSLALAHFVRLPRNARVLDLGAGCGTLGLLLCSKDPNCHVTGIELNPTAHETALENIRRNAIPQRMDSICGDLRRISAFLPGESFDCIVSNPPYFSGGPASKTLNTARREDCCSCADLFLTASKMLKYGGDFYLVHRPERLAELIARACEQNLEAKRLLLLRHKESGSITLVLLQFRKGGKPGLLWEEASLYDKDNHPTAYYRSVYHLDEDNP